MDTYLENGVKARKTANPSTAYSDLHRYAGKHVTMINIDSIEFDRKGIPLAVIETKFNGEPLSDYQRTCLRELGNRLQVPAFAVRHTPDLSRFSIKTLNMLAAKKLDYENMETEVSRLGYLNFLHWIHGTEPTEEEISQFMSFTLQVPDGS
jgi:hypothetical protein